MEGAATALHARGVGEICDRGEFGAPRGGYGFGALLTAATKEAENRVNAELRRALGDGGCKTCDPIVLLVLIELRSAAPIVTFREQPLNLAPACFCSGCSAGRLTHFLYA